MKNNSVDKIKNHGKKNARRLLDGQRRISNSSRSELKKAVKEARRQLSDLQKKGDEAQRKIAAQNSQLDSLRATVIDLKRRLKESEQQAEKVAQGIGQKARSAVSRNGQEATPAPAARKPAAKKPAARKPAARKPAAKKPAARKPAAKKPAARKPAAKKPE